MRCAPQLVTAYVDDELRPAERERIAAHLSDCPWCADQARSERALRVALKSLPEPPVPGKLKLLFG